MTLPSPRTALVTIAILAIALFLYGVWPTPYRYQRADGTFWRFQRFGDRAEAFNYEQGWVTVPNPLDTLASVRNRRP